MQTVLSSFVPLFSQLVMIFQVSTVSVDRPERERHEIMKPILSSPSVDLRSYSSEDALALDAS